MKKFIPVKIQSLAVSLSILLSACVSHQETPSIETFSLMPNNTITSTSELHEPIIRIIPTTISSEFANSFFIYRISTTQYLTDPYRQFLTSPNLEINHYLQHQLSSSIKGSVINSNNLSEPQYILQSNINELYADYQNKSAPLAIISIEFTLYDLKNQQIKQIDAFSIRKKAVIKANDPNSLMSGYAKNLDEISQEVAELINKKYQLNQS